MELRENGGSREGNFDRYRIALNSPKTVEGDQGYEVRSTEVLLEDVVGQQRGMNVSAVSDALALWRSQVDNVGPCQEEEVHDLLPAFKKNVDLVREPFPFKMHVDHIWNQG